MKTKNILTAIAIPAAAVGLFAQDSVTVMRAQKLDDEGVMMAQGAAGVVALSSEPGNFRFFTQEYSFNGRPMIGAPYSADEQTESVQTLADGTKITNSTTTRVYRDSQGRTRREISLPALRGDPQPHTMITISDPVAGVNYTLDSQSKVAHQMPAPPSLGPGHEAMRAGAEAKMKAEADFGAAVSSGPVAPMTTRAVHVVRSSSGMAAKQEDLGVNEIEGVSATGSRVTSVIEAGAMGNDRPITITSERWFSPDLQIEVKSVHSDPRMGTTTHTVTNINRTEPDATLFQVPSDYKIDEPKMGGHMNTLDFHP